MLDLPTSSSQQPNMPGLTTGVIASPAPTLKYDGLRKFTNTLKAHLSEGTNILEFSEVTKDDFSVLSSSKARPFKSVKYAYNSLLRTLTCRLPKTPHVDVTGQFRRLIERQLMLMGVDREVANQSSPLTQIGCWTKEPDTCWIPRDTDTPSVVLETGASETAAHLAYSARGWLETPGSTVLACITIEIGQGNELNIDVWRQGLRRHGMVTRYRNVPAVQQQHITIKDDPAGPQIEGWKLDDDLGVVNTTELLFDFSMFTKRPPENDLEHDIVLKYDILNQLGATFFHNQHRRALTLNSPET
ncbi:hypothetical protein CBS115989_6692 [Aspergillus niger]|uniref:Contig An09c0100, genomic contig n=3 Tax=Aspergillus niger TaxID=5061 RepID=A2QU17_ASPNC|nr:uncharacterized protein An09g04030 [Aspergillus niger]XP_025459034.1 uncharacterized protein BO96DRAFT_326261 [Aspergillus niger CBS 101883]RDH15970.1 hypothetical protein M747DRAFT_373860 [Aspergillus niger ATCC 13496]KAI2816614.1 hypothetical protein CBS115989_6692 [Aspergillus niger]KAI2850994.1 hypothetical protein CBS11232_6143 [Aspergillus niger]KAI2875900.1 hypothetical protein CBS115988_5083 [Aspergillus niger]KAI2905137.1 hypothetical protein CBS11852_1372 [Aspergillus niger]